MKLSSVYLLLAVLGGIVPYIFFLQFARESGVDLNGFVQALFANGASAGFTADVVISSITFCIAAFELHRRDNGPSPWPFIPLNLIIGLSFALPLYIFVLHIQREKQA